MTATTSTDTSKLSGLFKEIYANDLQNLIPESAKLVKMVPFSGSEKEISGKYHQPVIVANEHGCTYASWDAGAFALNDAVPMTTQDAQVTSNQLVMRSVMSYDAANRASNSKKAFVRATELLVTNMLESLTKRLEISLLYGGSGLCKVDTSAASGTTGATDYVTCTASAATWAYGIFAGLEGAIVNVYTGSSKVGTNYKVAEIDSDARTFKLLPALAGTDNVATIASKSAHDIFFQGAYGNEMLGIDKILTTSGTVHNISNSTYSLWKGNNVTVTGQLSMGKILSAVGKAVQKGLNEDVKCFVNPDTFANLASDLAALRKFDGSYDGKEGKNGFETLKYVGQNGIIEIVPYNIVKSGEAFILPIKRLKRLGASDISFKTPGRSEDIFLTIPGYAGFELRCVCDQAIFIESPARCCKISGFTNV